MSHFALMDLAKNMKALVLDVDGILSDGFITLSNSGDEIKSFDIRDGLGIKLIQQAGFKVAIITGRQSQIVQKRMNDLGVNLIVQGREDKGQALLEVAQQLNFSPEDCAYMGDDWPDLSAFAVCGLRLTVPNAHSEVRHRAHFITAAYGGRGAVREVCDLLLRAKNAYDALLTQYLNPPHSLT